MQAFLALAALVVAVSATPVQQKAAAYGRCGGRNHQGPKTCVAGFHCQVYNDWYAQCVPGAAASSAVPGSSRSTASITPSGTGSASAVWGSITLSTLATSINSSPIVIAPTATSSSAGASTTLQTKVANTTTTVDAYSSTAVDPVSASTTVAASSTAATGSYPTTSGTSFVIDGKTGYFAGTNTYWISFLTNNADVDLVMQHLQTSGLKILRVWGFNDVTATPSTGTVYFQSFANGEATINTGADGLERLDYVVKSAEAHGIKLIINFVNNWTDYGGMAAYFAYAGITDNTQWYNSTKAQTQYQAYIKAVVSRYTSSPAIFAWELANEPRCTGCELAVMTTWITETAAYIKSLDPNRMVTTGEEGFGLSTGDDGTYPYTTAAGGYSFETNCAIDNIDFCVYHLYPGSWAVSPEESWGNAWITNHAKACVAAGKPCLLEEYGAADIGATEPAWQATALAAAGTGGDLFWQYGDTLSTGQSPDDGFTVYYGTDLYTALVTDHVAAIDVA
ncbi:mannan endo-1,4-beta-mannosidase A-2 [Teratosphaeriaceae sp. CCFEE 6253]|nr:mannan endo-1,4-beta-mannosidase A-2 [Teratosphaeriaceae sp. CCFEE 6253]